jgi:thymidine kinase
MNLRIDEKGEAVRSGDQVEIGGNDRYVATCRRHFASGDSGRDSQQNLFNEQEKQVEKA